MVARVLGVSCVILSGCQGVSRVFLMIARVLGVF